MKPVVGYVGEVDVDLPEFEMVPYRPGVSVDAVLIVPGEFPPEGVPQWVPIVEEVDAKTIRRAIRRWAVTIEDSQDIRGPGTVVYGYLENGRLRHGDMAVREGHERSMRIREVRVDGRTVPFAEPGDKVALAFGPVPQTLFRHGLVLRPGRAAKQVVKEAPHKDVKEAILIAVGNDPVGRGTAAICKELDRTPQQLGEVFEALRREGRILGFAGQWILPKAFDEGVDRFLETLDAMHERQPQLASHPPSKVVGAARLGWSGKPLDRILTRLVEKGAISMREDEVRRPSFRVNLGERQRTFLDRVVKIIEADGINTPNAHELGKRLPAPAQAVNEILSLGEDVGEIISLPDGVLFTNKGLAEVRERIRTGTNGRPFNLGEMRDSLGTSRRIAVALLEYFDEIGFTERQGEARIVKQVS